MEAFEITHTFTCIYPKTLAGADVRDNGIRSRRRDISQCPQCYLNTDPESGDVKCPHADCDASLHFLLECRMCRQRFSSDLFAPETPAAIRARIPGGAHIFCSKACVDLFDFADAIPTFSRKNVQGTAEVVDDDDDEELDSAEQTPRPTKTTASKKRPRAPKKKKKSTRRERSGAQIDLGRIRGETYDDWVLRRRYLFKFGNWKDRGFRYNTYGRTKDRHTIAFIIDGSERAELLKDGFPDVHISAPNKKGNKMLYAVVLTEKVAQTPPAKTIEDMPESASFEQLLDFACSFYMPTNFDVSKTPASSMDQTQSPPRTTTPPPEPMDYPVFSNESSAGAVNMTPIPRPVFQLKEGFDLSAEPEVIPHNGCQLTIGDGSDIELPAITSPFKRQRTWDAAVIFQTPSRLSY